MHFRYEGEQASHERAVHFDLHSLHVVSHLAEQSLPGGFDAAVVLVDSGVSGPTLASA